LFAAWIASLIHVAHGNQLGVDAAGLLLARHEPLVALFEKVIVLGLDGLEPTIVDALLAQGELPNLARLRESGGYSRVSTTCPAQTPVAWSTFATGTNPGGHGIFDFIRRDPRTYWPDFSLNRYEQRNAFMPPVAVNLRRGTPIWSVLSRAGIESTILRCPCTFPPDGIQGRMLSGMGVPDLRGGLGTGTFYTSRADCQPGESEQVLHVARGKGGRIETAVIGPRHPKTREDIRAAIQIEISAPGTGVLIYSDGEPRVLEAPLGRWSPWLRLKFKVGLLQSVRGMVRFHLVRAEPDLELYASPVNFDPDAPLFPISQPPEFASDLEHRVGTFYTTGMVEDHNALSNDRISEEAYLSHCQAVLRERERMMLDELGRSRKGLFFCLFDTPDRIQHMFWRFREPGHPANRPGDDAVFAHVIEEHYRACDAVVGRMLAHADDRTLVVVLSDHGFGSFRRGVHLNAWLRDNGFLALASGQGPHENGVDFLRAVDWTRTKAYALGIGSIYLNLAGREAQGILDPAEAPAVTEAIVRGLSGLVDPANGAVAVRGASTREDLYSGPYASESPDVVVRFAAGYRASWSTALGGVPAGQFEDNTKKWGGDHIVDPALVPGALFMNRPFRGGARLVDMAPTILGALGVPVPDVMEGDSLL
jgi:predicted AlkP superfamily phosphohydrolase/phosphomutase